MMSYCIDDLIEYLTQLVNLSLSTGTINNLKESYVRPLPKNKKSNLDLFENYRPISNLPFMSKLIERVVLSRLNEHMVKNDMLNHHQFGYKKFHSCETLLLKFTNDVLTTMDKGNGTIAIMCDLSAAFDTVDHDTLIDILHRRFLISGTPLDWFKSFLSGRHQRVVIRDSVSSPCDIKFGVPQGSVLGPVLFNIYSHSLSDVFTACNFSSLNYADDTTGYFVFPIELQLSIDAAVNRCMIDVNLWMNQHFLKLNRNKTQIIIFGTPKIHKHLTFDHLSLTGCDVSSVTDIDLLHKVKYLGVCFDDNLSLASHINNVCSTCYHYIRKISSIRRFIDQADCQSLVHASITSRLDFCNSLYFGAPKYLLMKLQRVQNAAARLILCKRKYESISVGLKHLHWLNIEQRSAFKVLTLVYKCLNDTAPLLLSDLLSPSLSIFRHTSHTLHIKFCDTLQGRRAFSYCGPRLWNCLPLYIRTSSSLAMFKQKLKTYLFTSYDCIKSQYCHYAKLLS